MLCYFQLVHLTILPLSGHKYRNLSSDRSGSKQKQTFKKSTFFSFEIQDKISMATRFFLVVFVVSYLLYFKNLICFTKRTHVCIFSPWNWCLVQIPKADQQNFLIRYLKGQSHEKVGELRVWGISLGPN
jgi:hypothetical protein